MPTITYIQPDGSSQTIEVPVGTSVMHAAVSNGVAGIVGECGGSAMCATCHVHVEPKYLDLLPPVSDNEAEMLDFAATERQENSRLGCQIKLCEALDGLVVTVPDTQV
ncbi:2Fe-2S iron-sulfur cluster-binding protein [Mesorhizobium sp. RMAD-H1]|uniref:2Fe-2S iron-sulfur cluster-binding protein n=1 Tax=Mesorhizobium sp. RMAD-H1 TaxID=2587065 RepID=UPI001614ED0A|nr:2Fe-2S iron-sulfur cluster-binding protein [Mesorhizobium sp. RMAD-H1]MBB2971559.1 2Fe-2S ferredoxin [Mesorhizobium sp. RMAD-H1]